MTEHKSMTANPQLEIGNPKSRQAGPLEGSLCH